MHFNLKSEINDGPGTCNFLIGDTDRDGKPECIFSKHDHTARKERLMIYEFNEFSWQNVFYGDTGFMVLTLGLLDGDSLYDLWLQHYDTLCMFESPTPYSFPTQKVWTSPFGHVYSLNWLLDIADMDNDGKIDIVDAGEGPFSRNNLCIYENNGDNSFDLVFYDTILPIYASKPTLGDFDGDGKMEIAISNGDAHAFVIENTGDNSYSLSWDRSLSSFIGNIPVCDCYDVLSGPDMDGDGKKEIVFHASTFEFERGRWREDLFILESDGDNSYYLSWYDSLPGYSLTYGNTPLGHNYLTSTIADIDGDSVPELLLSVAHKVYILKASSDDDYQLVGEIYLTPLVGASMDDDFSALQVLSYDIDLNGLEEIVIAISYFDNSGFSHRKTLIFEKGIDLQWIYPNSTDTLTANSTITLKWKILDHYAVDSCFIFLSSPYNPQNKQLIFSGSPSDSSFSWTCLLYTSDAADE